MDALARDLGQTTTLSIPTARYCVGLAYADGLDEDRTRKLILAWLDACNAGMTMASFGDVLQMRRLLAGILGDDAADGATLKVAKDKGGPHGDG